MSSQRQVVCPSCGRPLSGTLSFCPVCFLGDMLAAEKADVGEPSSEETLEAPPGLPAPRFEHYELLTAEDGQPIELGRGAMGITYKAFDIDLQCPVALKVISEKYLGDESARLRFLREARAAASVRHPNVASVFHLGRSGRDYFYAMEFVEGETLESLVRRFGRLEMKMALEITSQVASGLAGIDKQKLVHRDIKPTNIMVSLEEGGAITAKIIDLGLAKPTTGAPGEAAISTPGGFAGTPEFASPEQFAGVGVDIRSVENAGSVCLKMAKSFDIGWTAVLRKFREQNPSVFQEFSHSCFQFGGERVDFHSFGSIWRYSAVRNSAVPTSAARKLFRALFI